MAGPGKLRVVVFGASGRLGRALLKHFLKKGYRTRATVHESPVKLAHADLDEVYADVTSRSDVAEAVRGQEIVLGLATRRDDPNTFFDVNVRGTFNVLDACRNQKSVRQVILASSDAAVGVWLARHAKPVNEDSPLMAHPGYHAFSKVMEEAMAQQYRIQYGLPITILRMSRVFEKTDILKHLSLRNLNPSETGHGWDDYLEDKHRAILARGENRILIPVGPDREPYRRHVVHIADVVQAFQRALANPAALGETFHIAGPAPFRYDEAARHLSEKTGIPTCEITAPGFHSFEIDISKARTVLGYKPKYDIIRMIDAALDCQARRKR